MFKIKPSQGSSPGNKCLCLRKDMWLKSLYCDRQERLQAQRADARGSPAQMHGWPLPAGRRHRGWNGRERGRGPPRHRHLKTRISTTGPERATRSGATGRQALWGTVLPSFLLQSPLFLSTLSKHPPKMKRKPHIGVFPLMTCGSRSVSAVRGKKTVGTADRPLLPRTVRPAPLLPDTGTCCGPAGRLFFPRTQLPLFNPISVCWVPTRVRIRGINRERKKEPG